MRLPVFASFVLSTVLFGQAPASMPVVAGQPVDLAALGYIDLEAGTGAPAALGKEFTVNYTGWLTDGTKFDSSLDRHQPFKFVQGARQVIAGWDLGFEGMKVGGKRRLFIPYQLAYGEVKNGPIPPKSELIFDVELVDVKDASKTSPVADLLVPLADLESKFMALAKALPEEKYSWRPSPDAPSFVEIFRHVANANRLLLGIATKQPDKDEMARQAAGYSKTEKQAMSKDQVVQQLAESFAAVRKSVEGMRPTGFSHDADLFGQATTRRGVFAALNTQASEQLGKAMVYASLNGIALPWGPAAGY